MSLFLKGWPWACAAALLIAPTATTAEAQDRPTPKDEAREILRDILEIRAAVEREAKAPVQAGSAAELLRSLDRPERRVVAPTLKPVDLDALVARGLASTKTVPAKLVGDETFVRRVYLDVIGKLPTPEQVTAFVRSKDKERRAKLIDQLLASPDHARNWARYWREVVQFNATNQQLRLIDYPALESWLADQLGQNRPWDEIATALITANGSSKENGAVVFLVAHAAQRQIPPVEVAGEVSRVFLGVQIQCAQCHDHPTDPWKREQFHEFAAFFDGTQARPNQAEGSVSVLTRGRASYTMPDLKDPQKQIPVAPKFFLADAKQEVPGGLTVQQRRELAASYVTGQDNPWFAKAFINRVWYALMGEAFYTPIDDLGPTREAVAPEVLEALTTAWQQGGYDVRWLFRTILNTQAYQRQSRSTNTAAGKVPFAANCPSRLRADQILDALVQAVDFPLARVARGVRGGPGVGVAGPRGPGGDPRRLFNFLFGVDPSTPNEDVLGTIPQALFLMNNPLVHQSLRADKGTVLGEILAQHPDNARALDALYLRVLARHPNDAERRTCDRYLREVRDRREVFEDILWALVNSTEFVSRR